VDIWYFLLGWIAIDVWSRGDVGFGVLLSKIKFGVHTISKQRYIFKRPLIAYLHISANYVCNLMTNVEQELLKCDKWDTVWD
jgi:hypothetical protein